MLDNSSSEEESYGTEELAQKFDWSSPGRRRKNFPSDEDVADILDGMYKSMRLYNHVYTKCVCRLIGKGPVEVVRIRQKIFKHAFMYDIQDQHFVCNCVMDSHRK